MCAFDLPYDGESAAILRVPLRFIYVQKEEIFSQNPKSSRGVTPGRTC